MVREGKSLFRLKAFGPHQRGNVNTKWCGCGLFLAPTRSFGCGGSGGSDRLGGAFGAGAGAWFGGQQGQFVDSAK